MWLLTYVFVNKQAHSTITTSEISRNAESSTSTFPIKTCGFLRFRVSSPRECDWPALLQSHKAHQTVTYALESFRVIAGCDISLERKVFKLKSISSVVNPQFILVHGGCTQVRKHVSNEETLFAVYSTNISRMSTGLNELQYCTFRQNYNFVSRLVINIFPCKAVN